MDRIIGPPFGISSVNLSLLRLYKTHCVGSFWIHLEGLELKLVNHDAQVLVPLTHLQVRAYMDRLGLSALVTVQYPTA